MKKIIVICLVMTSIVVACGLFGQPDREPAQEPELLWKYEGLGRGYGGPCVSKEGIFINAEENGNSYTLCMDHNGNFRWRSPNGKEFLGIDFSASYPGTRSAPKVKGRLVYAASGMGHLSCFDISDGTVIWTVDLINDLNGKLGDFGYSESPVVDEEKVYCFPGGREDNLVALDRRTGDVVWSAPVKNDFFAYDTPVLLKLSDKEVLVGTSRNYIHVVDRQDGRLLSSHKFEDVRNGHEHCNPVVYKKGQIYYLGCEGGGPGAYRFQLSKDGGSLTEVWRNPEILNVFGGFVVKKNVLYTTLETKKLIGLDTETGMIRHSVRAESGNIIQMDDKLIIYGHNGKLQFFELKNGIPELISELRIRHGSGHHFSFPVIVDELMYIRRGNVLMAYTVK